MPVTRIGRLANFGGEVATSPCRVEWRWPLSVEVAVAGSQAMCPVLESVWQWCPALAGKGLGLPVGVLTW